MDKTPMGCHSVTTLKWEKLTTKQREDSIQKEIYYRETLQEASREKLKNLNKMHIKYKLQMEIFQFEVSTFGKNILISF